MSDDMVGPKELRALAARQTYGEPDGPPLRKAMNDFAEAWEAERQAADALRDKLAGFIRDGCYKHSKGDSACSCEWLDEALGRVRDGE